MSSTHIKFLDLSVVYGSGPHKALDEITMDIQHNEIFGIVGPANSGKTTLLKTINRTLDLITGAKSTGEVMINGEDVRAMRNVNALRRRIGMVFPLPVGLPLTIYENVAYAPRRAGIHDKDVLDELVERCLKQAVLWDEVKDRLDSLGTKLSGGQQQRLTLARALAHQPEILCLDEFSIAIDPVTTMKIEDILLQLKEEMTIVLVTNLTQQARRLADHVAFLNASQLVEWGVRPKQCLTTLKKKLPADTCTVSLVKTMETEANEIGIRTRDLSLWYGDFQALEQVSVDIQSNIITSLIGPSGCGKTTLLRCFNRINERYGNVTTKGEVLVQGENIYSPQVALAELRKSVGMVFQRPNPLPISVADNILFGVRSHSRRKDLPKSKKEEMIETALKEVSLWNEMKDDLKRKATTLTLEQQQKLCIARLLPLKPEIILMDEPCSALDADGIQRIEELITELKDRYTIVIVTHNMAQARRASDECIFMYLGQIKEHAPTMELFMTPKNEQTAMYIEGRYG